MDTGLNSAQENLLKQIFAKYLKSGTVIIYGSRAKGNYSERSDIDLVIKGSQLNDEQTVEAIRDDIDESDFPYLTDLQYYEKIKNPSLIRHIDRVGKVLF